LLLRGVVRLLAALALLAVAAVVALGQAAARSAQERLPASASRAAIGSDWTVWRHDSARTGFNADESALKPPLKLLWKRDDDGPAVELSAADGLVFDVGPGGLRALNGSDGSTRWVDPTGRDTSVAPAVRGGRVFAAKGWEGPRALEESSGKLIWARFIPAPNNEFAFASGAVSDGYNGFSESTGETLWTLMYWCTGGGGDAYALVGRTVWAARNGIRACEIGATKLTWETDPPGSAAGWPAVAGGRLYVAWNDGEKGSILSLDAASGGDLKSFSVNSPIDDAASSAVAYGKVYFGATDGIVRALDADSLALEWQTTLLGPVRSSPAVANGVVYVTTGWPEPARLYALDADTGKILWSYVLPESARSTSPIVADGHLYVIDRAGCGRCTLYAFGSESLGVRPSPAEPARTLAERFGPMLVLMNGELCRSGINNRRLDPYVPESVEIMASASRLMRAGNPATVLADRPLSSIDILGDFSDGDELFLDIEGVSPYQSEACRAYAGLYRKLLRRFPNTTYATVEAYGSKSNFRVVVTYRFFYFFNDWINKHEGDWEHIKLKFVSQPRCAFLSLSSLVRKNCRPESATYGQHLSTKTRPWSDVLTRDTTHPLVFVGSGSHASYFRPGAHWDNPIDWAPRDPAQPGLGDQQAGIGRVIQPRVQLIDCTAPPPWWRFTGGWGEQLRRPLSSGPKLKPLCGEEKP